jgi:hypothetical protein
VARKRRYSGGFSPETLMIAKPVPYTSMDPGQASPAGRNTTFRLFLD